MVNRACPVVDRGEYQSRCCGSVEGICCYERPGSLGGVYELRWVQADGYYGAIGD